MSRPLYAVADLFLFLHALNGPTSGCCSAPTALFYAQHVGVRSSKLDSKLPLYNVEVRQDLGGHDLSIQKMHANKAFPRAIRVKTIHGVYSTERLVFLPIEAKWM